MSSALTAEIIEHFEALPYTLQEQIVSLVRTLDLSLTRDASGKKLLRFAGSIPETDLQAMRAAIETGCEQVDIDEWWISPGYEHHHCPVCYRYDHT